MPNSNFDQGFPITLRPASMADASLLLAWRNDEISVAMSLRQRSVSTTQHEIWLGDVLKDPKRSLLIACRDGTPIGTIRFDSGVKGAEVSLTISPECRGQGLGTSMLDLALNWAKEKLSTQVLVAQVRSENKTSIKLFERCGFVLVSAEEPLIYNYDLQILRSDQTSQE